MSEPSTETPATPAEVPEAPPAKAEPDWKAEARKWESRAKENAAKVREYEPIVEAQKTAEQRQAEELSKWQTEAQTWRSQALSHRIEALAAASEFADPSDAVAALAEKSGGYLDAGGQIDEQQIRADLADVLERKPHWRKQASTEPAVPRVPAPNPSQGSSGGRPAADPVQEFASFISRQLKT